MGSLQASDRLYYTFQTLVDAEQLLDSPEGSACRERASADLQVTDHAASWLLSALQPNPSSPASSQVAHLRAEFDSSRMQPGKHGDCSRRIDSLRGCPVSGPQHAGCPGTARGWLQGAERSDAHQAGAAGCENADGPKCVARHFRA